MALKPLEKMSYAEIKSEAAARKIKFIGVKLVDLKKLILKDREKTETGKKTFKDKVATLGSPVLKSIKSGSGRGESEASEDTKKESKEKKTRQRDNTPAKEVNQEEVDAIIKAPHSNWLKTYLLKKAGYNNQQCADFEGVKLGSISRDIWLVAEGHRIVPQELI